ncbi:hypothetical protein BJX70DRAFT_397792 [Aspergillus crustosus]
MNSLVSRDADMESHISEVASQDSPLRRKFSEPIHPNSNSTQTTPSPSPVSHRSICASCGEHFESTDDAPASELLKKHIAAVHPSIVEFSAYDGATDPDDESQIYDDDYEQLDDEDMPVSNLNGSLRNVDSDGDDNAEGLEDDEFAEATEMYDDEKEPNEAAGEGDGEVPEGESDVALSNQLHEFSREQDSVSVEKRLYNYWNIHDVRKFSEDYDESTNDMSETWMTVFSESKRGKKREASEILARPDPYKKPNVGRGEFLEMTPLKDFLGQLRDPELRSSDELYAITENVAYALKVWQDEFLAIDKLHKLATRHNLKITSDPRKLERPQIFEDKKEAMLYGYKHDPKEDKVGHQNSFIQGGFKPTPAQYRKMVQKVGPVNPNPDSWRTITRFGAEHVPKFQNPPREDFVGKATRKRKAAELEAANKATDSDEAAATETPTPGELDQDYANPAKRRGRNRRHGAEGEQSAEFMNGRPYAIRGRGGRPRGRGAARRGSRAGSEAPLAPAPPYGMPARSTPVADGFSQIRPGASQLVPIEPAPNGSPAFASSTEPLLGSGQDNSLDPAELARRQKIANSKNPKRTEAMLNHWARFNKEGRVRNPKRSKAQIEADRVAEAAKKTVDIPKPAIKQKQKSVSPAVSMPPRPDAGLAPAPPTYAPPPHLAPIPHTQSPHMPHPPHLPHPPPPPQLPPIARTSLAPNPPPHLDPRAVPPFPLGPRVPGPLHQPPPQPYRTPYPDYFNPYGAPGLPPPGHPRPA